MLEHEYASAIWQLASENGLADTIKNELYALIELLNDEDFYKFMNSLSIKCEEKKSFIENALKGFNELTLNFINVLLDNRRFNLIDKIYNEYVNLMLKNEKAVNVTLYSAKKLTDIQIESLKPSITNQLKCEKILVNNIVDDTLIGGITIYANDKKIDISVKGSLERLKNSL